MQVSTPFVLPSEFSFLLETRVGCGALGGRSIARGVRTEPQRIPLKVFFLGLQPDSRSLEGKLKCILNHSWRTIRKKLNIV